MLIKEVTATPIDYLRTAVGRDDAAFREEQLECIEAAVRGERLLVVQRTGWGKSIVYFIATRLLRDRGAGATLIVSPLLSLMRNQLAAAARIGLRSATINSANTEDWDVVIRAMRRNEIDVLLISPERLANDAFRQNVLVPIGGNIGLFVIDEAHCISDWGHDFRPDYRRISQLFKLLPPSLPVLATTATANNRVVDDVMAQLGNVSISRGPLVRKSLRLQNILLPDQASRLAWLAQYLPTLPGSGIVYTLTVRDAERVAEFLRLRGIDAVAYHADSADREMLESRLLRNHLKVLVATVALGMGFDKPDLGFVVHFQRPGSVVHYYQQVGRAGRALDEAFGILLGGAEDDEIIDFFIRQAFPPEGDVLDVLEALNCADDGLSVAQIESFVNLPFSRIERTLKLLATETPAPIRKEGSKWYRSPVPYVFNVGKVQQLTTIRRREQQRMQEYMRSTDCLMQFLAAELDDPFAAPCGKCANCAGRVVPVEVPIEGVIAANEFLQRTRVTIEPRKLWPVAALVKDGFKGKIAPFQNEPGRALSLWEDGGWAELVRHGKYEGDRFDDSLVDACAVLVADWKPDPRPEWLTCVPSKRHPHLVPDFAQRLAARLGIPYRAAIVKTADNLPQKQRENSVQQARNLDGVFAVDRAAMLPGPVLLVDDMTDSGWTLTVTGALLRRARCPAVFPLVLADASRS